MKNRFMTLVLTGLIGSMLAAPVFAQDMPDAGHPHAEHHEARHAGHGSHGHHMKHKHGHRHNHKHPQ